MRMTTQPVIVGSVEFTVRSSPFSAYLDEELKWHCSDPEIELLLSKTCSGDGDPSSESQGPWSVRYLLYTAAQRLGGQVSLSH